MRASNYRRKIISALATCLILVASAIASDITVQYDGNVIGNDLTSKIDSHSRWLSGDELVDSVTAELSRAGYLYASAGLSQDTLSILPGNRFTIGQVTLTEVSPEGEKVIRQDDGWGGVTASVPLITLLKEHSLSRFQEGGYYFASLSSDSVLLHEDRIDLWFKVVSGPVVRVGRVRFKGLGKTSPRFMANVTGLQAGQLFTTDIVEDATRKISALRYLSIDSLPRITPNTSYDEVELLFYIKEGARNLLEVAGGYLPSQGTYKGQFVGRLDYRIRNLFGAGRQIRFLYDKRDRNSSIIDFSYSQPVFVPQYLELSAHVNQTDYDSLYHAFSADVGIELTSGKTRYRGRLSWTKTEPERSSQAPARSLSGVFGVTYSSIGEQFNPGKGRVVSADFAYIRRTSWPDTLSVSVINNESSFSIGFDQYIEIYREFLFRLRANTHVLLTSRDIVPYSEQFRLGGYNSLRGYRQDQFSGRRVALIQNELLFRASDQSAVYVFGDYGYVYSKRIIADSLAESDTFSGFGGGLGLLFGSKTARLTLEIGWGEGDSAGDGKIHFGIVTLF